MIIKIIINTKLNKKIYKKLNITYLLEDKPNIIRLLLDYYYKFFRITI